MTLAEIRATYLQFFKARGHTVVSSASLVPQNDPTTLFTGSGMQPMLPYLLGQPHPQGAEIVDSQKCFRAVDIEEVGDNRHTTFFEMLGNWSFGSYFRDEQLTWLFSFLTDKTEGIALDPERLYVTAFAGDEKAGIPQDTKSAELWQKLFSAKGIDAQVVYIGSEAQGYAQGMQEGRIFYYDAQKNWWSRAGTPAHMPIGEPGGLDTEVFYDFGTPHDTRFGAHCHPNCDCGRFIEICNSVFMQYLKVAYNTFQELPKRNVDFGGGLERMAMVSQHIPDIIAVCYRPIVQRLEEASGKTYGKDIDDTRAFRIIADHLKASVFLIADGVQPANTERGYFVRRLLRRCMRYAHSLGITEPLSVLAASVADMYIESYPELSAKLGDIQQVISEEEERFRGTLQRGLREFEKIAAKGNISGEDAFILFSTYGFPIEETVELAHGASLEVDTDGFSARLRTHQDASRAGAGQKFKGGLADTEQKTVQLHTAHHLLLKALQQVLGEHVKQRGSNITQERLRIDFSHPEKLTQEQKKEVEDIVNEKIAQDLPVIRSEMAREKAELLHAQMEFGATYPEHVSIYSIGPKNATVADPHFDEAFSIEFCGGPHVERTSLLPGRLHIQKEEAVSAGIRRIKAVFV